MRAARPRSYRAHQHRQPGCVTSPGVLVGRSGLIAPGKPQQDRAAEEFRQAVRLDLLDGRQQGRRRDHGAGLAELGLARGQSFQLGEGVVEQPDGPGPVLRGDGPRHQAEGMRTEGRGIGRDSRLGDPPGARDIHGRHPRQTATISRSRVGRICMRSTTCSASAGDRSASLCAIRPKYRS